MNSLVPVGRLKWDITINNLDHPRPPNIRPAFTSFEIFLYIFESPFVQKNNCVVSFKGRVKAASNQS